MSNQHDPGPRLDAAIDRAVHRIMRSEPRADLRRRVLARLDQAAPAAVWWPRLGLAAATMAAIALAIVYMTATPDRPATQPVDIMAQAPDPVMPPPDGASERAASEVAPPVPPVPAGAPADRAGSAARVERLPDPPRVDAVFEPRPDGRVAAATVDAPAVEPAALPEIEPLQVPMLAATVAMDADAQDPPPAQEARPAQAAESQPDAPVQNIRNIRIDVTLTEEGEGAAAPKTVSILVANREMGRIRSGGSGVVLNVDARPLIAPDGRVRLSLTLEYSPGGVAHMSQSLTTMLVSGTPLVVSQSADPKSTRRVQAELTATILK